jgi:deoxyadenosine/deoxycytidine kinase
VTDAASSADASPPNTQASEGTDGTARDDPAREGPALPAVEDAPPLGEGRTYVVVEGVIGAGKTTLARLLAATYDARPVLERFHENPFLKRFYADRARWAFQTQLAFLASRFQQQKDLAARDLFRRVVVSDYAFDKDRIFARQTLGGDELRLYETLFRLMEPNTPVPDLVVYLRSAPARLMQNIRQRGRSYEMDMDPAYIEALHDAYDRYFFHYTKSPLLIVNAARMDFVGQAADRRELVRQIATAPPHGTTYVSPPVANALPFESAPVPDASDAPPPGAAHAP